MSYIVSWSGGKDCCFACYKAISSGYNLTHLLNLTSEDNFHKISPNLMRLQAESIDMPLLQRPTSWENYEQDFKDLVRQEAPLDLKGIIFGDQFVKEFEVQKHREWVDRVCGELGTEAIEPLWEMEPEKIIQDFIDAGFEAVVISARADLIGKEWVGQKVNEDFLNYLTRKKINACGELGEYHTFVISGPLLKKSIDIQKSRRVKHGKFWYLEILDYT